MADTLSKVILGPACRIKGEMHLDGDLQLHGHCEGSIHVAGTLDVRAEGSVRGLARAGAIRVAGTVDADLVGEQGIALLEGCHVTGRVFATRLLAVKGATVQAQVNIGPGAMAQAPGSVDMSTATADAKAAAVRSLDEIARQTHEADEDDLDEHAAATQMNAMEIGEVADSVADVEMMESVEARVPGSARASSAVPTSMVHAVDAVDDDLSHNLGEQAISVAAALDDADEQRVADDAPIAEAADAADGADPADATDEAEVATVPTSIRAVLQRRPRMSNLTAHSRRSA